MNTANPQLEGLYLALGSLLDLLVQKGVVSRDELRQTLTNTEEIALSGGALATDTDSHRKAMAFPVRFLLASLDAQEAGEEANFRELARRVGLNN